MVSIAALSQIDALVNNRIIEPAAGGMHGCMDGDGFPIHSNKGSVRVRSIPFFRTVRTLE